VARFVSKCHFSDTWLVYLANEIEEKIGMIPYKRKLKVHEDRRYRSFEAYDPGPVRSGLEMHTFSLCKMLRRHGNEVTLFAAAGSA